MSTGETTPAGPAELMWINAAKYLADTRKLTPVQKGAYVALLGALAERNGAPLPDDNRQLAAAAGVSPYCWRTKVRKALEPLFDRSDDGWRSDCLVNADVARAALAEHLSGSAPAADQEHGG